MNVNSTQIKDETVRVFKVWKSNRQFRLHDVTYDQYKALHDDMQQSVEANAAKERELAEIKKIRNKILMKLKAINVRVRSGFRGFYGPDSAQFRQLASPGAAPATPRKGKARKAAKTAPAA